MILNLPPEVLNLLEMYLHSVQDLVAFRASCKTLNTFYKNPFVGFSMVEKLRDSQNVLYTNTSLLKVLSHFQTLEDLGGLYQIIVSYTFQKKLLERVVFSWRWQWAIRTCGLCENPMHYVCHTCEYNVITIE